MMLCHQCLPTRHFVVRDQSYRHLSERKGCVRRYCCHGLSITPRPRDVHDLIERINYADYRDYAAALRSVLARLMLSREKVYDTIFLRGRGR